MTCVILFLMNLVPGLSLRATAEEEDMGLDDGQLGEFAYDYVEISRHITDILPTAESSAPASIKNGVRPADPEKVV